MLPLKWACSYIFTVSVEKMTQTLKRDPLRDHWLQFTSILGMAFKFKPQASPMAISAAQIFEQSQVVKGTLLNQKIVHK
jgi:hypothetical protein